MIQLIPRPNPVVIKPYAQKIYMKGVSAEFLKSDESRRSELGGG